MRVCVEWLAQRWAGLWWKSTSGGRGFRSRVVCGLPLLVLLGPRFPTSRVWGRALGVYVWVLLCAGGGSPSSVGEQRGGGGGDGEREQGAGKSTLAFRAWVPGPREAGGTPGGAWARARGAPREQGERPASPPEVAGAGVRGRDPPPAGTQPRSFRSECPPALCSRRRVSAPAGFTPIHVPESNIFESLRTTTRDYCVTESPTERRLILVKFSRLRPVYVSASTLPSTSGQKLLCLSATFPYGYFGSHVEIKVTFRG